MTNRNTIILATDDARLRSKAERLFAEQPIAGQTAAIALHIVTEASQIHEILSSSSFLNADRGEEHSGQGYVFIDLDAKEFNGYELAREVKTVSPKARIIASSLGIDPTIIQKTKLYGMNNVLQRYKFEELLKNIARTMQGDEPKGVSVDTLTH